MPLAYSARVIIFCSLADVEQQQVGQLIGLHAIARVDAVLQTAAKVLKELLVGLAVVVTHILKVGGNLLFHTLGDGLAADVFCCSVSREMLSDTSAESTTPRTKL